MTPDVQAFYNALSTTGAEGEVRAMIDRHIETNRAMLQANDIDGVVKGALAQALDVLEMAARQARRVDLARRLLIACNEAALTGITFSNDAPIEYFERVPSRIKYRIDRLSDEVASLQAFKRGVDEGLNSGDGSYRP